MGVKASLEQMQNLLENSKLLHHYLQLIPTVQKDVVVTVIMKVLTDNFKKIVLRMINTLIHQYFIEGGLKPKEVAKTTFQKTLTMPT